MRVGVYPVFDRTSGGIYQYSLMVLGALDQLRGEVDPVIVHDWAGHAALDPWTSAGWEATNVSTLRGTARQAIVRVFGDTGAARAAALRRRVSGAPNSWPSDPNVGIRPRTLRAFAARMRRDGIDLMLFPAPSTLAFRTGVPYIMAIHDLQHRIHPEFPEVTANGEREAREYLFGNAVRFADAILVDSEVGREDVLQFYGHLITPERVRVLPFVLPSYLVRPAAQELSAILRSLAISGRYLLFPAQFWPHKNHVRVTEAIAALHRQGLDVPVVMTGSASGPIRAGVLNQVKEIVAREGIQDLVRILGYVDDATMAALYAGTIGVILPTFFGPTNIPVIEAWAMGVPVLTSDIRGIREQCGAAAILVDPLSIEAITEGIRQLWTDQGCRERLVDAGAERLRDRDPSAFRDELSRILSDVMDSIRTRQPEWSPA